MLPARNTEKSRYVGACGGTQCTNCACGVGRGLGIAGSWEKMSATSESMSTVVGLRTRAEGRSGVVSWGFSAGLVVVVFVVVAIVVVAAAAAAAVGVFMVVSWVPSALGRLSAGMLGVPCKKSVFERLGRLKSWRLRSWAGKADVLGKVKDRATLKSTDWGSRLYLKSDESGEEVWWGVQMYQATTDMSKRAEAASTQTAGK
jgi:hypothetical protein